MKYLAQRLHGLFGQDRLATSLRRNGWHWNLENPGRLCNHLLRALGELLISETINLFQRKPVLFIKRQFISRS